MTYSDNRNGQNWSRGHCVQTQFVVLFFIPISILYNSPSNEEKISAFTHHLQEILNGEPTGQMLF